MSNTSEIRFDHRLIFCRKPLFRRQVLSAVCAWLVIGQPVLSHAAASPCMSPAVKTAFDISALKSDLMVTALLCHEKSAYNADIIHFRRAIAAQEGVLDRWFVTTYGASASERREDYITQMANARSQYAVSQGSDFCDDHSVTLLDVAHLRTVGAMDAYAAKQNYDQPLHVAACVSLQRPGTEARILPVADVPKSKEIQMPPIGMVHAPTGS